MPEIPPVDRIYTDRKADNEKKTGFEKSDQGKNTDLNKEGNKTGDRKEEGKGNIIDIEG
jgi:hypothetical protein